MTDFTQQDQRRARGRPFRKGESGNPRGRPPGSRNQATLLAERIIANDIGAVVETVVAKAKNGDLAAAKIIVSKALPSARDRCVEFDFPPIQNAGDARAAVSALILEVSVGRLSPSEATEISRLIDTMLKAIELKEVCARLEAVERAVHARDRK